MNYSGARFGVKSSSIVYNFWPRDFSSNWLQQKTCFFFKNARELINSVNKRENEVMYEKESEKV